MSVKAQIYKEGLVSKSNLSLLESILESVFYEKQEIVFGEVSGASRLKIVHLNGLANTVLQNKVDCD